MSVSIKLYEMPISGNCYKIRLFLSILGLEYERIPMNMQAGENRRDDYLAMNPNGQVPVIVDGDQTIYDSAAILAYLARTYGEQWLPLDPIPLANVVRWLAFEQSEGRFGLARARAIAQQLPSPLANMGTLEEGQAMGNQALDMLEQQLQQTQWLASDNTPTIADIACYPYTALSREGGLVPQDQPAISRWMAEIEAMEAYIPLPGAD